MRAKLSEIKEELRRRMHQPIPEQGRWLGQIVRGYFAYDAVPTNFRALGFFQNHVKRLWLRTLRRYQGARFHPDCRAIGDVTRTIAGVLSWTAPRSETCRSGVQAISRKR
jgi:hypothetical protein